MLSLSSWESWFFNYIAPTVSHTDPERRFVPETISSACPGLQMDLPKGHRGESLPQAPSGSVKDPEEGSKALAS
jgi:hypothetical protein